MDKYLRSIIIRINFDAINPWVDLNEDAAMKVLTKSFKAPDGAGDVSWQTYQSDTPSETEVKYIQLSFTMNGTEFHARGYKGLLNWNDISGMYYNWTSAEDGKSTIWGKMIYPKIIEMLIGN